MDKTILKINSYTISPGNNSWANLFIQHHNDN